MLKTRNEGLALELQFLNLFTVANLPLSTQSIKGALSIDDDWDEDDLPEVAEATWTLLHMLGSSSTRCRERENPLFGVQQWTWVNLLVFLPPPNPLSWKKFYLNCELDIQSICSLYFCTKTPENRLIQVFVTKHQRVALKRSCLCFPAFH